MAADVSKNDLLDQPMQIIHPWVNFTLVSPKFSMQFRRNQPEKTPELELLLLVADIATFHSIRGNIHGSQMQCLTIDVWSG